MKLCFYNEAADRYPPAVLSVEVKSLRTKKHTGTDREDAVFVPLTRLCRLSCAEKHTLRHDIYQSSKNRFLYIAHNLKCVLDCVTVENRASLMFSTEKMNG